jgi:DNA invertase Pin-like site-specific DNA recombinase
MAELQVAKAGARVVTTDGVGNGDDPGSRLMKDVALAAARFERSMIAARTKAALAVKKTRGESTGTPPYGWRVAGGRKEAGEERAGAGDRAAATGSTRARLAVPADSG